MYLFFIYLSCIYIRPQDYCLGYKSQQVNGKKKRKEKCLKALNGKFPKGCKVGRTIIKNSSNNLKSCSRSVIWENAN